MKKYKYQVYFFDDPEPSEVWANSPTQAAIKAAAKRIDDAKNYDISYCKSRSTMKNKSSVICIDRLIKERLRTFDVDYIRSDGGTQMPTPTWFKIRFTGVQDAGAIAQAAIDFLICLN